MLRQSSNLRTAAVFVLTQLLSTLRGHKSMIVLPDEKACNRHNALKAFSFVVDEPVF